MENILDKYNQLEDPDLQRQVLNFIDYLLKVKSDIQPLNMEEYKKKLLKVSTWTEEDLKVFNELLHI